MDFIGRKDELHQLNQVSRRSQAGFVCIRARKLTSDICDEVHVKNKDLKRAKNFSIRHVLIYEGELSSAQFADENSIFDYLISFTDLINEK